MENKKIKGTRDYYGEEAKKLNFFFSMLDTLSNQYSFNKIFAPTMEETSLFVRAVGEETDVVNKEMYTFNDRKERSITLKPEGTAQVVRLAIENKLLDNNATADLYYIDSMFRYERPQKGRQRQFFQFGVESFGKKDPYKDAELIKFASDILDKLQITKYELLINNIGNSQDRANFNVALKEFIDNNIEQFSDYAKEKIKGNNVLRVLDSKEDNDIELLKGAPKLESFINEESKANFEIIKDVLNTLGIKYKIDETLVRGLDYYNDLVFEFESTDVDNLGSKSTLIGGGRYDSLVNKLDNSKDVCAVGFALGIERIMLAAKDFFEELIPSPINYFIVTAYDEKQMKDEAIKLADKLRGFNFDVCVDFEDRKLAKKLERAEKANPLYIVIIGNEISEGKVTIKELSTNESKQVNIEEV